jgi:hypothetical protein
VRINTLKTTVPDMIAAFQSAGYEYSSQPLALGQMPKYVFIYFWFLLNVCWLIKVLD